jgi:hypothetical protein
MCSISKKLLETRLKTPTPNIYNAVQNEIVNKAASFVQSDKMKLKIAEKNVFFSHFCSKTK